MFPGYIFVHVPLKYHLPEYIRFAWFYRHFQKHRHSGRHFLYSQKMFLPLYPVLYPVCNPYLRCSTWIGYHRPHIPIPARQGKHILLQRLRIKRNAPFFSYSASSYWFKIFFINPLFNTSAKALLIPVSASSVRPLRSARLIIFWYAVSNSLSVLVI